jgi:hypothetical protein
VHEARATLASGQHVVLDFRTFTDTRITTNRPLVGEFLQTAVRLCLPLGSSEQNDLDEILALPEELRPLQMDFEFEDSDPCVLDLDENYNAIEEPPADRL